MIANLKLDFNWTLNVNQIKLLIHVGLEYVNILRKLYLRVVLLLINSAYMFIYIFAYASISRVLCSCEHVEVVKLKTNYFKHKLFIGCLHPIWVNLNFVTYVQRLHYILLCGSTAGLGPTNGKLADRYPLSLFTVLFLVNRRRPDTRLNTTFSLFYLRAYITLTHYVRTS